MPVGGMLLLETDGRPHPIESHPSIPASAAAHAFNAIGFDRVGFRCAIGVNPASEESVSDLTRLMTTPDQTAG
jgi:hypothetical protein